MKSRHLEITSQAAKGGAGEARRGLRRRLLGERGANLMEYVLLVSLIAVLCIAAVQTFRQRNTDLFLHVASEIP